MHESLSSFARAALARPSPSCGCITAKPSVRRILLVSHDSATQDRQRRALRADDCTITTAISGADGLHRMNLEPVDVVIAELSMPRMNGLVFSRIVRRQFPEVTRLLSTAADSPSIAARLAQRAVDLGVIHDCTSADSGSAQLRSRVARTQPDTAACDDCRVARWLTRALAVEAEQRADFESATPVAGSGRPSANDWLSHIK